MHSFKTHPLNPLTPLKK